MVIFEHRSGAYFWVREHRSAEKRHLQTGFANFQTGSESTRRFTTAIATFNFAAFCVRVNGASASRSA